ncbi:unnamed protein product [Oikopleura dioica]|uniref:Uncharacterized protein n=1 Tax=Oikopleura dioica TaxID=34765 RepID=E4WZF9_OIKDI|nr:unnamed protein product [Oikopleura dioica]
MQRSPVQIKINGASGSLTFESARVKPTRAHIRRIIHPFCKVVLQIAGEEIQYELGYPSDLIPYGPQSAVFDSFLQKINIGDIAIMEINDKQFKVFLGMVYYNLLLAVKEIGYMAVDWEYS